ncbi:hypothetical protein [Nocardioides sp.]|uniref:hypothetical protein n=1 Tax=Nocardioides sp. TaxID=35761 RepID=UPI0039E6CFED
MDVDEKHPVAAGLTALVAVGLAVGLAIGAIALLASHVLGIGDDDTATEATGGAGESLYLPDLTDIERPSGPLITLATEATSVATTSSEPAAPTSSEVPQGITLQAGSDSVGSMDRIDLSGVYPGGEGAVLQVQRRSAGDKKWETFPVDATVTGGSFSTYVQTGRSGAQEWRVKDTATGEVSNVVTVTVR